MHVVIIGPGKIGSGYLAPLFADAGWHVTLATRTAQSAARILAVGSYSATVAPALEHAEADGAAAPRSSVVAGVDAVAVGSEGFRLALAEADLVCTAVGVGNVAALGPALADALARRPSDRPLDVWVVENGMCADVLEQAVRAASVGTGHPPVGFAGAIATVAVSRGSWTDRHPDFVGDDARRLVVDRTRLVTALPDLPGVRATDHYRAELLGKLHVFNAGHAICAYLGWLREHPTVDVAVADPFLRPVVAGAMLESQRALLAAHPVLGDDVHTPVAEALQRFANPHLADPIARVARDPLRKLGPDDRLVGPFSAVRDATGAIPAHFALGIAGALLYHDNRDAQARTLQGRLSVEGVMAVLADVCGIGAGDALAAAVASRYRGFIFADDRVLFPPAYTGTDDRTTLTEVTG